MKRPIKERAEDRPHRKPLGRRCWLVPFFCQALCNEQGKRSLKVGTFG